MKKKKFMKKLQTNHTLIFLNYLKINLSKITYYILHPKIKLICSCSL